MFNRGKLVEEIERPDPSVVDALREFDVSTLHEAHKTMGGFSLLPPHFRCLPDDGASCVGVAVTALLPEHDNLGMHKLLSVARAGDVMVMQSVQSSGLTGMCGDLVALSAKVRGVAGIVANGSIRDYEGVRDTGLPVWFRRVNSMGMPQQRVAGLNVPLAMDGVVVRPGAIVVADRDGILLVEPDDVPELVRRATRRRAYEAEVRPRLEAGELLYDIRGLGAVIERQHAQVEQLGYPD